jgi:hypothetical protein
MQCKDRTKKGLDDTMVRVASTLLTISAKRVVHRPQPRAGMSQRLLVLYLHPRSRRVTIWKTMLTGYLGMNPWIVSFLLATQRAQHYVANTIQTMCLRWPAHELAKCTTSPSKLGFRSTWTRSLAQLHMNFAMWKVKKIWLTALTLPHRHKPTNFSLSIFGLRPLTAIGP